MAPDINAASAVSNYLKVPGPRVHDALKDGRQPVSVLVVDDDELKRYTLNRLLSPLGCSIVEADSGPAALRCLLVQDFAVILLDIRLPGMSGFEIATLIRKRQRSKLTPIMMITASTREEIVASGMFGDQAAGFMFAPTESDEMRATIMVFADLFRKSQEDVRRADEAQASADCWRLLTEAAPVGIFQTDRNHRYTHTNPRWSEITGIPAEVALGQDWRTIVDAEQALPLVIDSEAPVTHGVEVSHRIQLRVAGASPKMAFLTSKQILDAEGGPAGWVGSLTDLTAVAQSAGQAPRIPALVELRRGFVGGSSG